MPLEQNDSVRHFSRMDGLGDEHSGRIHLPEGKGLCLALSLSPNCKNGRTGKVNGNEVPEVFRSCVKGK